ncbi:MAG: Ig-like domain-containing protein, partial [Pseudomonadota bacterium]
VTIMTLENRTSSGHTPEVIDVDAGDSFSFSILAQPAAGSAYIFSNQLYYEPQPDINGTDSFSYRAYDSGNESVDGTAQVIIVNYNDPPVADSKTVVTDEDVALPLTLDASDPDGNTLVWTIVDQPSNGLLDGAPPVMTYMPASNYYGTDSFTFRVNDGIVDSDTATVSITVNSVNDPPESAQAVIATEEDTASAGTTPVVIDADVGDSHTFTILTQPGNGTASLLSDQLVYDPAPDYYGTDSFTFRASDSGGESVDGTATVTIAAVNDPPVSTSVSITTAEDTTSQGVTPGVVDVDNEDSFTFSILTQPLSGSAYALSNQLYYDPLPDTSGTDSFTYRAFDSGNEFVDGVALVTVTGANDPPVADTQTAVTDEDVAIGITLTASDVDGDELTWTIVDHPLNGALAGTPPVLTYAPDPNYYGTDSFTFKVNDGTNDSAAALVSLTINPVPDIWFVDIDAAGTGDGSSWSNAFNHPRDALDEAGAGDELWVAEGVYTARSGSEAYVIEMAAGVNVYGGFAGTETSLGQRDPGGRTTVLDGQDTARVVSGADSARLDGFTITRGWSNGMVNSAVSPTVANCIFENNGQAGESDGGGIRNISGANAYISSCVFVGNYRSAVYNESSSPTITNCDFLGNTAADGGALKNQGTEAAPYISGSVFEGNSSSSNGGAIYNLASSPLVQNCVFMDNIAGQSGGAVANSDSAGPNIVNSAFLGNTAAQYGGAFYNAGSAPTLINCTVVSNTAADSGGGIANFGGRGKTQTVVNSILWSNSGEQVYNGPSSKSKITYSDVQGGFKGVGNIDVDPALVDISTGDIHLAVGSPCIDEGSNSPVTTEADLDGNPRILDGNGDGTADVDMGAYEYQP